MHPKAKGGQIRLGLRKILALETAPKGYWKETRALPDRQQKNTLGIRIEDPGMANLACVETLLDSVCTKGTQRIYPVNTWHFNNTLVCTD